MPRKRSFGDQSRQSGLNGIDATSVLDERLARLIPIRVMAGPVLAMHVFGQIYSIHFERGPPCQKVGLQERRQYSYTGDIAARSVVTVR
jgi:hypothetical protein